MSVFDASTGVSTVKDRARGWGPVCTTEGRKMEGDARDCRRESLTVEGVHPLSATPRMGRGLGRSDATTTPASGMRRTRSGPGSAAGGTERERSPEQARARRATPAWPRAGRGMAGVHHGRPGQRSLSSAPFDDARLTPRRGLAGQSTVRARPMGEPTPRRSVNRSSSQPAHPEVVRTHQGPDRRQPALAILGGVSRVVAEHQVPGIGRVAWRLLLRDLSSLLVAPRAGGQEKPETPVGREPSALLYFDQR